MTWGAERAQWEVPSPLMISEKEYIICFHSSVPSRTVMGASLQNALEKAKKKYPLSEIIEVIEGEWKQGYREHLYRFGHPL